MPQDNTGVPSVDDWANHFSGGNSAPVPAAPAAPSIPSVDDWANHFSSTAANPPAPAPTPAAIQRPQEPPGYLASAGKAMMGGFASQAEPVALAASTPAIAYDKLFGKPGDTTAQDWMFRNVVDPVEAARKYWEPGPNEGDTGYAIARGVGGLASMAPLMVATGGVGAPVEGAAPLGALARAGEGLARAAPVMGLPAASNTAMDVANNGGTLPQAYNAGAVSGLANTAMGALPIGMAGNLLKRGITGAGSFMGGSELARRAENAVLPENMQQQFSLPETISQGVTGFGMGAMFGHRLAPKDILAGDKEVPPLGLPNMPAQDGLHAVFSDGSTTTVGEAKRQGLDLTGATILPPEHAQAYSDILKATQPPLPEGQLPIPKRGTNIPTETPAQTWRRMAPEDTPTFPEFKDLGPSLATHAQTAIENLDEKNPASMKVFESAQNSIHEAHNAIQAYIEPVEGGEKAGSYSNVSKIINSLTDKKTGTIDTDKLLGSLLDHSIDTSERNPNAARFRNAAKALGGMDDAQVDAAIKARAEPVQQGVTNEKTAEAQPVEAQQPEAPAAGATEIKEKSFKELADNSNDLQKQIDARHDELEKQGVSWEDQKKDQLLEDLYKKRISFDTAAAQKGYDGAKAVLEKNLKGLPESDGFTSHTGILRELYSLIDKPNTGAYMMSKYTGEALDSPKTIVKLSENIARLIFHKKYPHADYGMSMESNMSGLSAAGKAAIKVEARSKAEKIHSEIRDFFIGEKEKENAVRERSPEGVLQQEQGKAGEAGSKRVGVEQGEPGTEAPAARQATAQAATAAPEAKGTEAGGAGKVETTPKIVSKKQVYGPEPGTEVTTSTGAKVKIYRDPVKREWHWDESGRDNPAQSVVGHVTTYLGDTREAALKELENRLPAIEKLAASGKAKETLKETGVVSKNRIELKDVSPENREIVKDVMGWDDQGNMVNRPKSLREAAKAYEVREDKPISHTSIANRLKAEGFDADAIKYLQDQEMDKGAVTPISAEHERALLGSKENNTGMGVVESPGASLINTGAGKGWKGLLAAKVPFNDRRWTNDMLAEAAAKKSQLMEPIAKEMAARERARLAKVEAQKGKAEAEVEHPLGADEERDIWAEAHGDEAESRTEGTDVREKIVSRLADEYRAKSVEDRTGEKTVWGAKNIKDLLNSAVKEGTLTPEMRDFASWFIDKNPSLVNRLGMKMSESPNKANPKEGSRGKYDPFDRVATIFKGTDSKTTAVHEMLHHLEQLMPKDMQREIKAEYLKQLKIETDKAKADGDTARFNYLTQAKKRTFAEDYNTRQKMLDAISAGDVSGSDYRFFDPSEFWAVSMTDRLVDRYNNSINNKGIWEKTKQWLTEAIQHIRSALGLSSDSPMLKAMDKLLKSGNGDKVDSGLLKATKEVTKDTYRQSRAANDFASPKANVERKSAAVDTMLKGAIDRVQKIADTTPLKSLDKNKLANMLGWQTKRFMLRVADGTPGLKAFSAHIKENMRIDELMNQVKLEIDKKTAPFANAVERLQMKHGRAEATRINAKMGALAQESSLRGLDPRASWEENLARNPTLSKRENEADFNEFRTQYKNFERQYPDLAKAIGGAHNILSELYSKSMATRMANFIRGSTKGELANYVKTLDYRNAPRGADAESLIRKVFTAAKTLPADSEMRGQMAEFEKVYDTQTKDPYFHLGRSGDYFARIRLSSLDDATHKAISDILEKSGRGATDLKSMKEDGIFLRTETQDEAGALRRALTAAAGDKLEKGSDQHGLIQPNLHSTVGLNPVMRSILTSAQEHVDTMHLSVTQAAELKQAITRDFMSMLPETSSKKAMMRRKGVSGYDNEFLKNFSTRVQGMTQDLSSIYTAHQYAKNFKDIDDAINGQGGLTHTASGNTQVRAQQIANELQQRHVNSMQPTRGDWVNTLNSIGHAFYLAMSPAFILRTMFQPWHRGLPLLGGQYGANKSAGALMGASADVTKIITRMLANGWKEGGLRGVLEAGLDMSKTHLSPEEKAFMQEGMDRGKWNIGQTDTLLRMAQSKGSLHGDITRLVSIAAQVAEMTNRMIVGLAAHRLSGGDTEHALEMSERVMDTFDPTANARLIGRHGFAGKVTPLMTSFMSYNLQTMQQLYLAVHDGMFNKDMSAEGKLRSKQAKKEFAGLMATTTMLSGVMGLPFMSAVAGLYNWLGKDDDRPGDVRGDIQNFLKSVLGGKAGEIASHGLSRGIGVDLSTTGMQNLLPGSDFLADRHLFKDRLQSQAISTLGPAANAGIDVAAALARISDGYYMKGLEAALPSGLKPIYKVGELLAKGYTDSLGNPMPIKATPWDVMVQASGFTPADKARYQEASMIHNINEERLSHRKQILTDMAYKALSARDPEAVKSAIQDIKDFNKANPTMPITSSSLKNAFKVHAMRIATAKLPGLGVGVSSLKEIPRARADTGFANVE